MKQTDTRTRRTLRKLTAAALEGLALLAMEAAFFAVCVLILETI